MSVDHGVVAAARDTAAVPHASRAASASSASLRDDEKGITVLVIEDRAVVREATAALLRDEGYGVVEAADGYEGLQHLKARPVNVDVVLLDLHMPRIDGLGVLDALDDPPPVIVHSAYDFDDEDSIRARYETKVCAFLQKPAAPHVLLEVISSVASRRGASDR